MGVTRKWATARTFTCPDCRATLTCCHSATIKAGVEQRCPCCIAATRGRCCQEQLGMGPKKGGR